MKPKAYVLCGLPGSGKSTWITRNCPTASVCSTDHFFVLDGEYRYDPTKLPAAHRWALREWVKMVQRRTPLVVCDNTNTTVAELAPYVATALAHSYETSVVMFSADVETSVTRNVHSVPLDTIQKMARNLDKIKESMPSWWTVREMT